MKVGFVGLGHLGAPMSRHILAAGHDLVVHDLRRPAAAAQYGDAGGEMLPIKLLDDLTGAPLRIDVPRG
jgi:3-hydroxyisobutyrate dehydrogenase-like beta-hydroxyacid dehydrogenase